MTTLTHFVACTEIHDTMTTVRRAAANAAAIHDHELCQTLNVALGSLAVAQSITHGHYCGTNSAGR